MQMRRLAMMLCCTLPMAAMLYGCGSSNKSGSGTPDTVATVGDTACIQCHGGRNIEVLTGEDIINQYKASSPHQNSEHANNGNGCEACHGNGGQHNGVGPIAFPNPYDGNGTRCADCHKGNYATNAPTHFAESRHAKFEEIHMSGSCARCHTHEGALLSNKAGITGEAKAFDTTVNPTPVYTGAYSAFKCSTCHEHGGGLRSIIATNSTGTKVAWNPSKAASADAKNNQFNLCTSCHVLYNYDGSKVLYPSNYTATTTDQIGGRSHGWHAALVSTHYDDPATAGVAEGYNIRRTGGACFDCHGHEAKTNTAAAMTDATKSTIHTDWAQSGHAGGLLAAKYTAAAAYPVTVPRTDPNYATQHKTQLTAVLAAGADSTSGDAWVHYNWDKTNDTVAGDRTGRADCQRCHTATGASNFMNNPAGYNKLNNNFSHLSGWTATAGSPQQEVMYCWGCHTNAGTGSLRTPGAITETYATTASAATGTSAASVTVSYPDMAGSNVCMTCHVGREIGDVIKATTDDNGVLSFINSHYLSAGATLFGKSGYEYDGKSYAKPSYFAHDKIGSASAPGTGSNGPCAGCHMTSPNSHKFTNVTKTAGVITALTSTACITCHDGSHGAALTAGSADAATFLATEEHHYHAALDALKAALDAKGIYFFNAHPYFYAGPNGTLGAFTNWAGVYGLAKWKDTMGAAFNYNLLHHDPGGYAHNRMYAKRLIFDAIDFIDNGVLDGTISVTGDAATYLGTTRP